MLVLKRSIIRFRRTMRKFHLRTTRSGLGGPSRIWFSEDRSSTSVTMFKTGDIAGARQNSISDKAFYKQTSINNYGFPN